MKNRFAYAVAALVCGVTVNAGAQVYRCISSNGSVEYSSSRCGKDDKGIQRREAFIPPSENSTGNFVRAVPNKPVAEFPSTGVGAYDYLVPKPTKNEKSAASTPNLFDDLIPKPATDEAPTGIFSGMTKDSAPAPVQEQQGNPVVTANSPRNNQVSGLGKVAAAGILVAILAAPKRVRNALLVLVAGLFVIAFGYVGYESARPPTLPFAQCVIDNVPLVRNDVAAYAAASLCVQLYGGYNNIEAKRYLKGQAIGFMTPKSRAECVTKYASNTSSEMAAKLIYGACNCLYQSHSEGAGETSYSCG